jgi:hypothetical protein
MQLTTREKYLAVAAGVALLIIVVVLILYASGVLGNSGENNNNSDEPVGPNPDEVCVSTFVANYDPSTMPEETYCSADSTNSNVSLTLNCIPRGVSTNPSPPTFVPLVFVSELGDVFGKYGPIPPLPNNPGDPVWVQTIPASLIPGSVEPIAFLKEFIQTWDYFSYQYTGNDRSVNPPIFFIIEAPSIYVVLGYSLDLNNTQWLSFEDTIQLVPTEKMTAFGSVEAMNAVGLTKSFTCSTSGTSSLTMASLDLSKITTNASIYI